MSVNIKFISLFLHLKLR